MQAGKQLSCADLPEGMPAPDGKGCTIPEDDDDMPEHETPSGTYTTQGGNLLVMENDDTDPSDNDAVQFCVQGNTLTVRITPSDGGAVIGYTATRN
jgi:hypothetical protein